MGIKSDLMHFSGGLIQNERREGRNVTERKRGGIKGKKCMNRGEERVRIEKENVTQIRKGERERERERRKENALEEEEWKRQAWNKRKDDWT
jgi:hypothetical protein